jgi:hypothetical protein
MNYTDLCANIQDVCENTFTADQLAMFVQQTETKVYNAVQIPALRKNVTGLMTAGNKYLSLPSDFLYVYSIAIEDASGNYVYLLDKDVNFIREAYPSQATAATPRYYAVFDYNSLILGPMPDAYYTTELHYGYYPESIVTASTSWLGDNFDPVLLNGALVEAIRFMKGEPDMVALYEKMFQDSMGLLKVLGDGKLRQDTYRTKQPRVKVT